MKAAEVRKSFLEFFVKNGHEEVHSSSLVPANDPTLLFTNAGMVQFKDVFTGREKRSYTRAASSQKCVRAGGKHNDLDEVGRTARHHTFFEMLGNFSFGDYFKKDAIAWAWELLTGVWGIDPERLIVTVFRGDQGLGVGGDDEARGLWRDATGFGTERIIGLGKHENFWMMGETGPMGPCSEIHYYGGEGKPDRLPGDDESDPEWENWLEIWNLVFMQYERKVAGGPLDPLPAPSIDTGAGLERVTSVLQGVRSNYDTDLFTPLLDRASEICGVRYGTDPKSDVSMRVIADHSRAATFLIGDGVFPEKTKREYVLRRIFRRAVRHGKLLGIEEPFMHSMCTRVVDEMKEAFPELEERRTTIERVAEEEERVFRRTLDNGLELLEDEFGRMEGSGQKEVAGTKVFQLYDTYGFPVDLTEIIAEERGYTVDMAGFDTEMEKAKERSRDGGEGGDERIADIFKELEGELPATEFLGYEGVTGEGKVLAILADGARVESAGAGTKVSFVCDRSPFYAAAGGQIGDTGEALADGLKVRIDDTIKPAGGLHVHKGEVVEGTLNSGAAVRLEVDEERRNNIRANHSATHLLHLALKRTLGDHVAQKGSLVAPDRLRFDFAHFNPMSDDEKRQVENWVNAEVRRNADSETEVLPIEEAKRKGAVAMFGEKYGDEVRVVHIGTQSLEFCGGTHVRRAGDIGFFKILSEAGISQGVRRIEAVTGPGATDYVRKLEDELASAGASLKVAPMEVSTRVGKLQAEAKRLEREVSELKTKLASGAGSRDLMSEVEDIGGVKLLATSTEVSDAKALRATGDTLRDRIGSGVILLLGVGDNKVAMVAMVTKDLTDKVHAGKLLGEVAGVVGGRGGGKPHMAQGGGNDTSKVAEALARAREFVGQAAQT
jgi:alanyl-tRNA synthetase